MHKHNEGCKHGGVLQKLWIVALILIIMLASWVLHADAAQIKDEEAIRAVLGEARGEGYRGMYAVACAIRNRGHLKGVYGLRASMPDLTPDLWQKASKAWFSSLSGPDVTNGATHWENVRAFGRPYWASDKTTTIGNHVFYSEVK